MKIRKIVFFIILLSSSCYLTYGQGGSNYSIFGIGDIQPAVTAQSSGLAGTGIAMPVESSINTKNPALWSFMTSTRLQAGYNFNQNQVKSDKFTLYQNNGKVNGIMALFSVDTSLGLSFSLGVHPYTTVNYLLTSPVAVEVEGSTVSGLTTYQGSGGISIGYFGGSISVSKNLSLGAEIFGTFGYIRRNDATVLDGSNNYPSANNKMDNLYGLGYKGGIFYSTGFGVGLGAFCEIHNNFSIDRTTTYSSYAIKDTSFTSHLELTLPLAYGLGVSYQTGKFLLGADLSMQNFTNFDYNKDAKTQFNNNLLMSIGISRLGNKSLSAPMLDKMAYNFGFCYKQLYYTIDNQSIKEYFGSIGFEIPIVSGAMLNTGLQFGTRGTTNNKLIMENFGRLNIDISIGETWFKPFKREY